MAQRRSPGLNELMIVNPGAPGSLGVFLGEDGILYEVRELGTGDALAGEHFFLGEDNALYWAHEGEAQGSPIAPGQHFLGDDGILYQVGELAASEGGPAIAPGTYLLAEDGTLYQD